MLTLSLSANSEYHSNSDYDIQKYNIFFFLCHITYIINHYVLQMPFTLFPFLFGYTTRQFIWPLMSKECCSIHLFMEIQHFLLILHLV